MPQNMKPVVPALVGLVIATFVFAALGRGPWLDEYWSVWLADPTVGFRDSLAQKWLLDVHPPLYSALAWGLDAVAPIGIVGLRIANLVVAAVATAVLWAIAPAEVRRRFVVFAVMIVSAPIVVDQMSNARAYVLVVFTFLLFAASTLFVLDSRPQNAVSARRAALVLPIAAIVCLNSHYVVAMHVDLYAGLAFLWAVKTRNLRAAGLLAVTGIVANGLLIGWFLAQKDFILAAKDNFWIDTTTLFAFVIVVKVMISVIPALVATAVSWWRERPARLAESFDADEMVRVLIGPVSSVLFVIVLLVLNLKTPIVQDRYLITVVVALAMSLAFVFVKIAPAGSRTAELAIAGLCVLTIGLNLYRGREPRWDALRGEIAAQAAEPACRDVPVYWDLPQETAVVRNQDEVFAVGYRDTFARWKIEGRPLAALPAGGAAGGCPIVVLYEHARSLIKTKSESALAEMFLVRRPDLRGRPVRVTISSDRNAYLVRL